YLSSQVDTISHSLQRNSLIQLGLVVLALAVMFNIYSAVRKREKQMELDKALAERNSRAKSAFLFNMSHDIRTPMNAIVGYTTLARKEKDIPPKMEEYLAKIDVSSQHMLAILNDVLEMSRIESGKMVLDLTETDLLRTLDEISDIFATQMTAKNISFSTEAVGVTDELVMCDKNCLNRVFLNLISNAYKFTPDNGSISVTLTETGSAAGFGEYEIRVRDNGIGMSEEFLPKIFEAFEREKTSTVSGIQGTGLGMAITKSIIDLMDGTIDIITEQGKGTEFIINVRFKLVERSAAAAEENGSDQADFSSMKLLLVEDILINREIAMMLLGDMGFTLDTAENGKIAVEMVANSAPGEYNAVLMDIQMPVMNGYEATRAIRALADPQLANIPIIAMTANAFAEDVQAAREAGMNAHIAKPIDVAKMTQTLTEILQ
ncbi:MAG: response regulator, partial [Firmicutes bacterium]|nr:response regulator [Bacillota bacterium]